MSFTEIKNELNTEDTKVLIDSIINVDKKAAFVIDRENFEVLYMNDNAEKIFHATVGTPCYEIFCENYVIIIKE